jgi:hypothetical protein
LGHCLYVFLLFNTQTMHIKSMYVLIFSCIKFGKRWMGMHFGRCLIGFFPRRPFGHPAQRSNLRPQFNKL